MKNLFSYIIAPMLPVVSCIFNKKNDPDKVSVVAFKLLGDAVFTIPAVRLISENFPGKKIILFCFDDTMPVYQLALKNIEYAAFKRSEINFNIRVPNFYLIRTIRKYNSSILFDLTSEYQTAAASLFSGAKQRIGFNTKYFEKIFTVFSVKRKLPDLTDMHLEPALKYFGVPANENRKVFKRDFEHEHKILIHPFAGWKAKEWDLKNFIDLAEDLNKDYTVQFIVSKGSLSGTSKTDIISRGIGIIETESVLQLINELRNCSLIISNDTGPIYVAALLGKATFSLYGPTNPLYSLPKGSHHEYVNEKIFCSPEGDNQYCYAYGGRQCEAFECMAQLSYDRVKNRLDAFIKRISLTKVNSVDLDN